LYLFGGEVEPIPDNDGQECAEPIQNCDNRDLDDTMDPALDVVSGFLNIGFPVMSRAFRVRVRLCSMCALAHEYLFVIVKEVRCFERFRNKNYATKRPDNCDDTLNDI
jgi:hypothetical protein